MIKSIDIIADIKAEGKDILTELTELEQMGEKIEKEHKCEVFIAITAPGNSLISLTPTKHIFLSEMTPEKQVTAIAEAVGTLDTAQKLALFFELFGKSGREIFSMLKD